MGDATTLQLVGAFFFGLVVGWITYRTIRRSTIGGLADIATVIGAVGGAAVTGLFPQKTDLFGSYCIGLAIGFFGYLLTAIILAPAGQKAPEWLGSAPGAGGTDNPRPRGSIDDRRLPP